MARDFSSEGLLAFLREAALTGAMHPATARSRRKAAEALLSCLSEDEASDLRRLDFVTLRSRLADSPRSDLRPEVADLYAERLAAALDEYRKALEKRPPRGAGPGASVRSPTVSSGAAGIPGAEEDADARNGLASPAAMREEDLRALESVRLSLDRQRTDVFPIPLERDRVVFLHGLPHDLSDAEARKIARVVHALAHNAEEDGDAGDAP